MSVKLNPKTYEALVVQALDELYFGISDERLRQLGAY